MARDVTPLLNPQRAGLLCRWLTAATIALAALTWAYLADAAPRSSSARTEFRRHHPCPATGQQRGACPGYVIDHIVPLCAGGADAPGNMQWQTVEAAKAKDREERRQCR